MDAHVLWLCSLLARVLQQLSVGMLLVSIWVFSVIVVDGITDRRLWKRRPAMKLSLFFFAKGGDSINPKFLQKDPDKKGNYK
jgi:hypothetical protein